MRISVVIPVYNGGKKFGLCLEALWESDFEWWECIVVDDGSVDGSADIAQQFGAIIIGTERPQSGPAAARNLGVQSASGNILFFIDADVLVKPDTLGQVDAIMSQPDSPAACIGAYDDRPTEANFLSQYRNLLHHFTHQQANAEAATFWCGCGAISRQVFTALGGFDDKYSRPRIEDIELGYRLREKGYRIVLDRTLQVRHMKRWTAVNMLMTDIRDRAIPWAKLILEKGAILNDLNLSTDQRVCSAVSIIAVLALIFTLLIPQFMVVVAFAVIIMIMLNRNFYRFLFKQKGLGFTLLAMPWHWLYFIYSGLSFGLCWLWHNFTR